MTPTFQTIFAVPMTCNSCIDDIKSVLSKLNGITEINADLSTQLVATIGSVQPSLIVAAIQSTGRDAILRGSGQTDFAAVCILETHSVNVQDQVRGLIRMVQVSPALTLFDIAIRGVSPGTYYANIRSCGDISRGPESTGRIWDLASAEVENRKAKGILGPLNVDDSGIGSIFIDKPIQIWELVGRSIVISPNENGPFKRSDENTLVGVIARSAGVWDNDKTVCSCTGKTVWEERTEQTNRGML